MTDMTETLILLIDNDRKMWERVLDLTGEVSILAPSCSQVRDGIWTVEQGQRFLMADGIRQLLWGYIDSLPYDSFFQSLVSSLAFNAFHTVEWGVMADHYIRKHAENRSNARA